MIRYGLICILLASVASAQVPVVPKFRLRMGETTNAYQWREIMTDGTGRDSEVLKPKPIPQPIRVRLIATNDVGFAWRFDYEVTHDDGSVATNASFRTKPPREKLADKLALKRPEMPPAMEQFHDAKEHAAKMADVRERAAGITLERVAPMGVVTQRMERRVFVASSRMLDHDSVELRRTDGTIITQAVHRVVGARVAALDAQLATIPEAAPDPPIDTGHAASAIGGLIVGALGAAAFKRKKVTP